MILVGACWQATTEEGAVAVTEASLEKGWKRYRIHRLDEGMPAEPEAFIQKLVPLLEDGKLRRPKRLFSQDRRPIKTIMDAPKVVAYDDGSRVAAALRARGTVVEAVRFVPGKKWAKELVGKALGANYAVDPAELAASVGEVIKEGRVEFAGSGEQGDLARFPGVLAFLSETRPERISAAVLAVALPLWFRETVPYRRAYRAM
jgi:hypothetical protein